MKHNISFLIGAVGILILSGLSTLPTQAYWLRIDRDNADSTAYAMMGSGAGQGYTGHAVRPGDVAVHYTCTPGCWPVIDFGTYIYFKNGFSVSIPNGSRNPPTPDTFTSLMVNDDGGGKPDPYWIDVSFWPVEIEHGRLYL